MKVIDLTHRIREHMPVYPGTEHQYWNLPTHMKRTVSKKQDYPCSAIRAHIWILRHIYLPMEKH